MEKTNGFNKEKMAKIFFGFVVIFILFSQILFTLNSTNQIRYEELAESIRNVYWLQNQTIYDGVSSNVGWYGTLLLIYNFFGFSLHSAKFFRLIIHLISIFCLIFILKKYFDNKKILIPLLSISLSPTFLYFNTLQTSYGLDLSYFSIFLFLLVFKVKNRILNILKQIFFWNFLMVAWLSYPIFIFYLPSLLCFYLWSLIKEKKETAFIFRNLLFSAFSFLFPLFIVLLYVKDKSLLFYDQATKSGLFRGAGILHFNLNTFWKNILNLLSDLFFQGNSYYFEIPSPDFSNFYPVLTIIFIFFASIFIFIREKKYRPFLLFVSAIFLFNLLIANFTFDPSGHPGIRRNTGILTSIYIFFTLSWLYFSNKKIQNFWLKRLIILIFLLLPLHHLLALPTNLDSLKKPSFYRELWFGLTNSPHDYLTLTLNQLTKEDLRLSCKDKNGKFVICRYSEIYAATKGACFWNKLECKKILGYDPKIKKFIPLDISLWEKYYFEH